MANGINLFAEAGPTGVESAAAGIRGFRQGQRDFDKERQEKDAQEFASFQRKLQKKQALRKENKAQFDSEEEKALRPIIAAHGVLKNPSPANIKRFNEKFSKDFGGKIESVEPVSDVPGLTGAFKVTMADGSVKFIKRSSALKTDKENALKSFSQIEDSIDGLPLDSDDLQRAEDLGKIAGGPRAKDIKAGAAFAREISVGGSAAEKKSTALDSANAAVENALRSGTPAQVADAQRKRDAIDKKSQSPLEKEIERGEAKDAKELKEREARITKLNNDIRTSELAIAKSATADVPALKKLIAKDKEKIKDEERFIKSLKGREDSRKRALPGLGGPSRVSGPRRIRRESKVRAKAAAFLDRGK